MVLNPWHDFITDDCFCSGELQGEEMDTSPKDIFILDRQPEQEKPGRQQEKADESDELEEADGCEEHSENDHNDSVSALKGVSTKERGVNGVKNRSRVYSDESSDQDDDVDVSTVTSTKPAVVTSCILTNASWSHWSLSCN